MKKPQQATLIGLVWVSLLAGSQAVAQYGTQGQFLAPGQPDILAFPTPSLSPQPISPPPVSPQPVPQQAVPPQPTAMETRACESCGGAVCLDGGTCDACALGPCCAVCGRGSCCPDDWYVEQGVRILTRSKPRFEVTSRRFDSAAGTFSTAMTTRTIGFDTAAGYLATVGHYLGRDAENRDHFVEFTYWGMNTWTEGRTINGSILDFGNGVITGNLFTPFDSDNGAFATVGGFNRADEHSIWYQSRVNNYELNVRLRPRGRRDRMVLHSNGRWRRECQPGEYTSYLFGFRTFSIREAFTFGSRGQVDDNGAVNSVSGDYNIRTHNDLFGLQFGGDYMRRQCKWQWGFRSKAGLFVNFSDQFSTIVTDATDDPMATTPLDISLVGQKDAVSLLFEIGVAGSYRIRPNMVLHGAYDFMWVTGLALAPEQLTFQIDPPDGRINKNGHIYSHGLTLDLELTW